MHSKKDSILKRWHSFTADPVKCAKKWAGQYWDNREGYRVVSCAKCPSYSAEKKACGIGFGSPLRKCVVSSIEAHMHDCKDKNVLEIGFGRFMLARNLIKRSGGTWTGVEPRRPKSEKPQIGKGGYGLATEIPFEDATFDKIFAVQSIEHWGQRAGGFREPSSYKDCMTEIARVLKSGGSIYFDAPIHFHGNEMFLMGDLEKIRSYFPKEQWRNVQIEKWRQDPTPLSNYPIPQKCLDDWPIEITQYPDKEVERAKNFGNVWFIAITAEKI